MADDPNKDAGPAVTEPPKAEAPKAKQAQGTTQDDLGKSLALVQASIGNLIQTLAATFGKQASDNLNVIGQQVRTQLDGYLAAVQEGESKPKKKRKKKER